MVLPVDLLGFLDKAARVHAGAPSPSYLAVSAPLLSAPSGAVAPPVSARQRRAVSVNISSIHSYEMVCMCLTRVVWSGTGSPSQAVPSSPISDSVLRYVWLCAIIHRQAKSSFSLEWTGGLPPPPPPDRGRDLSRIRRISVPLKWAASAATARS